MTLRWQSSTHAHWLLTMLTLVVACAPAKQSARAPQADFTFADLGIEAAMVLSQPFKQPLIGAGILLQGGQAFAYEGDDERAFFAVVDRFYLENPGFCPVPDGFLSAGDGVHLTLTARPTPKAGDQPTPGDVRVLVYDQTQKPKLKFAFLRGHSQKAVAGTPCRTAAQRP